MCIGTLAIVAVKVFGAVVGALYRYLRKAVSPVCAVAWNFAALHHRYPS